MNQQNPKAAEEKFKELSEAYEVLADKDRRQRYDQMGFSGVQQDFGPQGFTWQNFSHASDLEDLLGSNPVFAQLFGNLFGGGGPWFGGGGPMPGRNIEVGIRVPLALVLTGGQSSLDIPRVEPCAACDGTGAKGGTAFDTCERCEGRGRIQQVVRQGHSQFAAVTICPVCRGTGRKIRGRCPTCRGSGQTQEVRRLEVQIPAGVETGSRLRLAGQGLASSNHGPAGDLYVRIEVEEHPTFRRDGRNLFADVTVPLATALLGGEVAVPRLEGGTVALKVPAGTQPEQEFRLKGEGLPRFGGGSRGDLYVTARVQIPRSLSSRQKELLQEALPASGELRRSTIFGRKS